MNPIAESLEKWLNLDCCFCYTGISLYLNLDKLFDDHFRVYYRTLLRAQSRPQNGSLNINREGYLDLILTYAKPDPTLTYIDPNITYLQVTSDLHDTRAAASYFHKKKIASDLRENKTLDEIRRQFVSIMSIIEEGELILISGVGYIIKQKLIK